MTKLKKEYIFLGAPASGKGTQTSLLSKKTGLPHIDTGALLREAIAQGTEDGKIAKIAIDDGRLVPIDVVANIIKSRLLKDDCKDGFILDGYPRSLEQADKLEVILKEIDNNINSDFKAIYFDIDETHLIDRIVNRRSCPKCGEIYNLKTKKTEVDGLCDICKEKLIQRKDDTEETAHKRFQTFYNETEPLVDYYKNKGKLKRLDADGTVEEVFSKLESLLEL